MNVWQKIGVIALIVLAPVALASNAVHEYQLDNRLRLIVKEDHRAPVVLSSIWYKVGGSYEHNGLTGISHMLEHMMFRGTPKYPAGELDKLISQVGGEQNAMTTDDYTMYYQLLPANQLALSFALEADRMKNLQLTATDFTKEHQVVMEERRMRFEDNPQALTFERFMAAAFVNNPYHHQTIGWMTDLQHMTASNVRDWYNTWYQPNNAIIVVVGDVQADQVMQLAKKYFNNIPFKAVPKLAPRTEIPALGTIRVKVNLPAQLPIMMMGYQVPSLTQQTAAWKPYALDVLVTLLGGTNSSRLQNDLLRKQQLVTSVQTTYDPFDLHNTLLQIFVIPAQGHSTRQVKHAIMQEIKKLKTQLVDAAELQRIKAQIIADKIYSRDSLSKQALILGTPAVIGLSWQLGENYLDAITRITPQQVQQVAQEFLIPRALTIALLHPLTVTNPVRSVPIHDKTLH